MESLIQSLSKPSNRLFAFLYISLAALSYWLFFLYFFKYDFNHDHILHVNFAIESAKRRQYLPHPLYHILLNIFTGFSPRYTVVAITASIILTVFVILKITATQLLLSLNRTNHDNNRRQLAFCLLILFFASPILNWWQFPSIYLGQFTPTIWHNPTTIICMPFCIGIIIMLEQQTKYGSCAPIAGSALLALSILAKPNFGIAFIPAMLLMTIFKQFKFKDFLVYSIPATGLLAWQNYRGFETIQEPQVVIKPLVVWLNFTPHPVMSLLLSLAFPAAFLICFYKETANKKLLNMAWLLTLISITQFLIFAENNFRMFHANFFWGTVPSLYILFLASTSELVFLQNTKMNWRVAVKKFICYLLLSMHFLSGIMFYIRSLKGHNYAA